MAVRVLAGRPDELSPPGPEAPADAVEQQVAQQPVLGAASPLRAGPTVEMALQPSAAVLSRSDEPAKPAQRPSEAELLELWALPEWALLRPAQMRLASLQPGVAPDGRGQEEEPVACAGD